ncbi:chemotaxis protein CheB [Amycolatopsis sp. K13G38]|uniref:protein-glutamate methylesterase n=1 Tax=Amycolatopsis acididurans TaxID=2724524 RepID=A0ABX1J588_9PSEU|nr:chemotaxis protein CheB [Amycolatopsis acididurans]NKQ54784.1 chemotaxis protein CheB [Amycolatopsis acididurans]
MLRPRDLVVVGASAGGVEALSAFAGGLPGDLPASVLVVLHLPPGAVSALPAILARSGPLPVREAEDGEPMERSCIYTAPPDRHLLVEDGVMRLSRGPTENGHRPAIDALFRSAARAFGSAVTGVVLSGSLDDGVNGLELIKTRGGRAVVQDPGEAVFPSMPENALARVEADFVLPAKEMGGVLADYVREHVDPAEADPMPIIDEVELHVARSGDGAEAGIPEVVDVSEPSGLACPDCDGVLFSLDDRGNRYRCRVGHAWTAQALFERQTLDIEHALWAALRALEEQRDLAARMARDATDRGFPLVADRYQRHREESAHAVSVLRRFLYSGVGVAGAGVQDTSA